MVGRKKKKIIPIWCDIIIVMEGVVRLLLGKIQIRWPLCSSWMVSTNGTRPRKNGRKEAFICMNKNCKDGDHKTPKQFILTSSYGFKELIFDKLKRLYEDLLKDGAKNKTIAKKYNISVSQISALHTAFEEALDRLEGLDKLVKTL